MCSFSSVPGAPAPSPDSRPLLTVGGWPLCSIPLPPPRQFSGALFSFFFVSLTAGGWLGGCSCCLGGVVSAHLSGMASVWIPPPRLWWDALRFFPFVICSPCAYRHRLSEPHLPFFPISPSRIDFRIVVKLV